MKKYLIFSICLLSVVILNAQIKVDNTGYVGINNSNPTHQLDVSGDFRAEESGYSVEFINGYFLPTGDVNLGSSTNRWVYFYADYPTFSTNPQIDSDESFKTDITDFSAVSGQLNRLRAVKYKLKKDKNSDNTYFGFIAQEVLTIFPEIVVKRKDGTYGIRYSDLIPVIVKSLQEQNKIIDELKIRVEKLEDQVKTIDDLNARLTALETAAKK